MKRIEYENIEDSNYTLDTFASSIVTSQLQLDIVINVLTSIDEHLGQYDRQIVYCIQPLDNNAYTIHYTTEDIDNIDDIVNAFNRGQEENGWTWRSVESIANETGLSQDEVTAILSNNDLFEVSTNGRKYRYLG